MENTTQKPFKLITSKQMRLMHVLLNQLCENEKQINTYKDGMKSHYNIPSTWQLTRLQAKKVIDRLGELVEVHRKIAV